MVTDLVRMQEKYGKDKLQVIGVTRFHGHGTDFADGPEHGKPVGYQGGRLSEAAEIEVNEHFAKAFKMNFPIVFTAPEVSSRLYSIFAIPALFVLDRRGVLLGVATGNSHDKVEALVAKALAEAPPATGKEK